MDSQGKPTLDCDVCGQSFKHSSNLKRHRMNRHVGFRPYVCCECGDRLATLHSLRRHTRLTHNLRTNKEPLTYPCPCCPFIHYKRREKLKSHFLCEHPNVSLKVLHDHLGTLYKGLHAEPSAGRSFHCSVCGAMFATLSLLRHHIQGHEERREVLCTLCRQSFANYQSFIGHHCDDGLSSTASPSFVSDDINACDVCQQSFPSYPKMLNHRKSCLELACASCQACLVRPALRDQNETSSHSPATVSADEEVMQAINNNCPRCKWNRPLQHSGSTTLTSITLTFVVEGVNVTDNASLDRISIDSLRSCSSASESSAEILQATSPLSTTDGYGQPFLSRQQLANNDAMMADEGTLAQCISSPDPLQAILEEVGVYSPQFPSETPNSSDGLLESKGLNDVFVEPIRESEGQAQLQDLTAVDFGTADRNSQKNRCLDDSEAGEDSSFCAYGG
ncbi:unnamed protein product [Cyprideis torosa]|uniref:Uncharacterized protein n=1 Tax=Cyprideis torosa TaxID=163714 RepID=A0A7R8WHI4_9CRUS|nr:unnamed protein product [Cyprideis torosa]CAG0893352.1 unnamed protein product [Cyprideis torosa]